MRYVLYGCPPCGARWWIRDRELNPGHDCPQNAPHGGIRLEEVQTVQAPEPERVA